MLPDGHEIGVVAAEDVEPITPAADDDEANGTLLELPYAAGGIGLDDVGLNTASGPEVG